VYYFNGLRRIKTEVKFPFFAAKRHKKRGPSLREPCKIGIFDRKKFFRVWKKYFDIFAFVVILYAIGSKVT